MSYPLGVGHSGGGECKGCCLGGVFHVRNTLQMCITPQQHCSTSLLYKKGYTAEVLGKTVVLIWFRTNCIERT